MIRNDTDQAIIAVYVDENGDEGTLALGPGAEWDGDTTTPVGSRIRDELVAQGATEETN